MRFDLRIEVTEEIDRMAPILESLADLRRRRSNGVPVLDIVHHEDKRNDLSIFGVMNALKKLPVPQTREETN